MSEWVSYWQALAIIGLGSDKNNGDSFSFSYSFIYTYTHMMGRHQTPKFLSSRRRRPRLFCWAWDGFSQISMMRTTAVTMQNKKCKSHNNQKLQNVWSQRNQFKCIVFLYSHKNKMRSRSTILHAHWKHTCSIWKSGRIEKWWRVVRYSRQLLSTWGTSSFWSTKLYQNAQ